MKLRADLPFITNFTNTSNTTVTIGNQPYDFTVAGEGLTLKSGWTMAFYITVPDRVMVYDLASPLRMIISTTQTVYCTETLVQTA